MTHQKLDLHLLSQSGEVLSSVRCFAGQVSVFRAAKYSALQMYQRALAGIPGPERISILLDGAPFTPNEHIFIGFGEHMGTGELTLSEFIQQQGLEPQQLEVHLTSFGITTPLSTPLRALSRCEERRVRLITATQQVDKMLVLNDPLEPLANEWRERFAELLVWYARTKNQIVIITSLSFRPESWIDNASIARIQVGEESQRTIGFGTAASAAQSVIDQLRAAHGQGGTSNTENGSLTQVETEPEPSEQRSAHWLSGLPLIGALFTGDSPHGLAALLAKPAVSASVALGIIGVGGYVVMNTSEDLATHSEVEVAPDNQIALQNHAPDVETKKNTQEPTNEVATEQSAALKQEPIQPPQKAEYVLEEYPPAFRDSIMASFRGEFKVAPSEQDETVEEPSRSKENESAGELLKLLESTSESGAKLPDSPSLSSASEPSLDSPDTLQHEEEKREAIRKKFLEAIERAQQLKQAP